MIKHNQPHSEYLADPAIGSSQAKLCLDSLQLFRDDRDGLIVRKPSKALTFGTVAHAKFLQPSVFADMISTGPINDKTGKPYGQDTQKFQEWSDANPGKVVMTRDELTALDFMDQRMPAQIRAILSDDEAQQEVSIYQTYFDIGIKCRPDHIDMVDRVITDLKTIDDINSIRHAMKSYKYWFQQEWYKRVLLAETGEVFQFRFIFAEKSPPYRWKIVTTSAEVCEEGASIVNGTLMLLNLAQKNNMWNDTAEITQEITWPDCGHYEEDQS